MEALIAFWTHALAAALFVSLTAWELRRGLTESEQRMLLAAFALTGLPAARGFQHIEALPMYEEMVVTGAWWDYVDGVAGQRFWTLLQNDREAMTKAMLAWSTDDNVWKRRSSIICQLHAKAATDLELLYACIEPSIESKEFFLRKAIGWALRQYARTDPAEVRRYVARNEHRLSALSRREALKHIGAEA